MILLIRCLYQVARGDVLITQEFGAGHSLPLGNTPPPFIGIICWMTRISLMEMTGGDPVKWYQDTGRDLED